jgi:hypothetical protein
MKREARERRRTVRAMIPDLDVSPLQRHGCDAALEKNGSQTLCRKIA